MDCFYENNDVINVFTNIVEDRKHDSRIKISIIGCGPLGGACGASLINTNLPANIVLIEPIKEYYGREKKLCESLDYSASSVCRMSHSTDIKATVDSDICLVCFEEVSNNKIDSMRIDTYRNNFINFKKYVPEIVKMSPNVVLVVLTYPYYVMVVIAHKIAKIPKNRIIGVGTSLSTSKFQIIVAEKFNISPKEVEGYVVGTNIYGTKIPLWSTVNVCGINLNTIVNNLGTEKDPLKLYHEFRETEEMHEKFFLQMGPPRWTVALLCAKICHAITFNTKEILTIPTNIKGIYNNERNCIVSVPCIIGRNGIYSILKLQLNARENQQFEHIVEMSVQLSKKFSDVELKKKKKH